MKYSPTLKTDYVKQDLQVSVELCILYSINSKFTRKYSFQREQQSEFRINLENSLSSKVKKKKNQNSYRYDIFIVTLCLKIFSF